MEYALIRLITFLLLTANCLSVTLENCNSVHGRDLTQLAGSWEVHYNNTQANHEVYLISICSPLTSSKCDGSSVCSVDQTAAGVSYGNFSLPPNVLSTSEDSVSFYLEYNTTRQCIKNKQGTFFYRSSITFECAKTLGSPEVISSDDCSVDFLWETSRACRPSEYDATKEVRCYAYDSEHEKRDLSSLVKRVGGYHVIDPSTTSWTQTTDGIYINVCRDIKTVSGDSMNSILHNCPPGAAACLVAGDHSYSLGEPTTAVNLTSGNRLVLHYEAKAGDTKPPECSSFTPQVIITFVCPGNTRGGSKSPIITSALNCQYAIEWWTEAACPASFVTSKTCGLDNQQHGIEIDLSPLQSATKYNLQTGDSDGTEYLLNVCGNIHTTCGTTSSQSTAMCQITKSYSTGYKGGLSTGYQVQYLDDQLSITYKNGDRCHSNGLRRTTVIVFHCNRTAGLGKPTFNHELHCTYYFDWETVNACVYQPVCHITDDKGQIFDLSSLSKVQGTDYENWEALTAGKHSIKKPRYFINVCGEVLRDRVTSPCPPGAAVCSLKTNGHFSFGSFKHFNLTRQSNKLILFYSDGDNCGTSSKSTVITLYCKPGDLEGSPVMRYVSSDGCQLHLTWYTAAACPLKAVTGDKCVVSDEDSGLTFDLRRLTRTATQNMYKVTTGQYDYYLNVCGKLSHTGTACDGATGNPATCQVEKAGSHHFITGQMSETLTYYNGFIKLLYTDGDSYRSHLFNRSTQISFLCDTKAGAGNPQFVSESNHTYLFSWYTSYVCPAASVQCMATDQSTGDQYDLSSLAKSEDDEDANWSVMSDGTNGKTKYYLNICRPVNEVEGSNPAQGGCDALAGACETSISTDGTETISVASLGQPGSAPVITGKGDLTLTYSGGSPCTEDGHAGNFSTKIHLVCTKGALSSSPRFLSKTACTVSFMWNTEAACAIVSSSGVHNNTDCEVTGRNSGYTFNLQPLIKPANQPYVVKGNLGDLYELNVCGAVTSCFVMGHNNVAGCRKRGQVFTQQVGGHSAPTYSDDGVLAIKYQTFDRVMEDNFVFYQITFVCNRKVVAGTPSFSAIDGNIVRFEFQTSLACPPEPVDCLVTDDVGNQYDLSPLSRATQAWQVIDDVRHQTFHLSVCRPLPPVDNCSGTGMGACMVEQSGKGHNLGLVQSNPVAVSNSGLDSAVSITYSGGDICVNDTKRRYSTRILFQCSQDEGTSPVLQPTSDPCDYLFVWSTPVACPVTKVTGGHCQVTEPLYNINFDLSPLTQSTDYNIPANNEWNFTVNICSPLKQATGACKDSGSCQVATTGSLMHNSGSPSSNLTYEDGVITLQYLHGETCHGKFERSTTFRFTCDHEDYQMTSNGKPTFINETDDCTYIFDWPTARACPPIKIVGCTAQHNLGEQYDLSPLSLSHTNYEASTRGDTGGRSYYINVCRSLLHQQGVTCPPNSAACMKKGKKFVSLGTVTNGPHFNGDTLRLTYDGGDQCATDHTRNYSTVVTFQCKQDAAVDTTPVVVSTEESCVVQMLWVTKAACTLESQKPSVPVSDAKPCTVLSPSTGHMFNLSSMTSATYYDVSAEDGRYFHINVCQKNIDTSCPDGTGSCYGQHRTGPFSSAGKISNKLMYTRGALALEYSDGAVCPANNKYKQTSTISFVCHRTSAPHLQRPNAPSQAPVLVGEDEDTCSFYFSWHTHLACEVQQPCAVVKMGGLIPRIFDMSDLIAPRGHYIVVSDLPGSNSSVFFINVCRPLEPMHGINCPPGSAACEVIKGKPPKSLGYIDPNKHIISINNDSVTLEYPSDEVCATNRTVNVSTRIIFTCEHAVGKGSPHLVEITSDCVYLFTWGTSLVCEDGLSPKPQPTEACMYKDIMNHIGYDLSMIQDVNVSSAGGSYQLSLCSAVKSGGVKCGDSSACFTDNNGVKMSLGKSSTRKISSSASKQIPVEVQYTGGDTCPHSSEKRKTSIMLRCDRSSSIGPPTVVVDSNRCHYIVYWPTPYVCAPPEKSCLATDTSSGSTYDLSLLSSVTHSWSFKDDEGNVYYMNLCRSVHKKQCSDGAAICRAHKADNKFETLAMLQTQTIHATQDVVTVRYTQGDAGFCDDKSLNASVEITLKCGKSANTQPKFIKLSQSDCVFHVEWLTRIACANQPQAVTLGSNGGFTDPKSGAFIDLSALMNRTWDATGDTRQESSGPAFYHYLLNLGGTMSDDSCGRRTTVCQKKLQSTYSRKVGQVTALTSYVMTDESLEITFQSNNNCGGDATKNSHSLVFLYCSRYNGLGKPVFIYEANQCGYVFEWGTDKMCVDVQSLPTASNSPQSHVDQGDIHEVSDKHNRSVAIVAAVFSSLAVLCVIVLIFHKGERRSAFKNSMKRLCGFGGGATNYRYIRSGDDDEGTSLFDDDMDTLEMHQETSLLGTPKRQHGATNEVPFSSLGGAGDPLNDDIFDIPEVGIKTSDRKNKSKSSKTKKGNPPTSTNPFEDSDSDDLLPFLKKTKQNGQSRAPGVGREAKVASYHDEDDEDLLEG